MNLSLPKYLVTTIFLTQPDQLNPNPNPNQIESGYKFSCAIDNNGILSCWGYDASKQVTHAPTNIMGIKTMCLGEEFGCIVVPKLLTPFCWGSNANNLVSNTPTETRLLSISCGRFHVCGITEINYELLCWGRNNEQQLNIPSQLTLPRLCTTGNKYLSFYLFLQKTVNPDSISQILSCFLEFFYLYFINY